MDARDRISGAAGRHDPAPILVAAPAGPRASTSLIPMPAGRATAPGTQPTRQPPPKPPVAPGLFLNATGGRGRIGAPWRAWHHALPAPFDPEARLGGSRVGFWHGFSTVKAHPTPLSSTGAGRERQGVYVLVNVLHYYISKTEGRGYLSSRARARAGEWSP